jgi:hypothetical protein
MHSRALSHLMAGRSPCRDLRPALTSKHLQPKIRYIGAGGDPGDPSEVRREAKFDKEWEKKAQETNGTISELMQQDWSDWETIVNWDEAVKGCSEKGDLTWDRLVEAMWPHTSS